LVFTSGCSVRGLADCPPIAHGPSTRCEFFACSSSFYELARRSFEVPKFCGKRFGGPSARRSQTVRVAQVALGQSPGRVRTIRISECASGGSVAFNGLSTRGSRTVRLGFRGIAESYAS
jgi:hypothetical protein